MVEIELKYGKGSVNASITDGIDFEVIRPAEMPGAADTEEEVNRALREPINSRKLSEISGSSKTAVVLVSDATRPSPTELMLPPLVEELKKGGIDEGSITAIVGLGIHRPTTDDEKKRIMGQMHGRIECIDHDPNDCVSIGTTSSGTDVEVLRRFVDADVKVATGSVEYHYFAGYTGGAKAVIPGVCSKATIQSNHCKMTDPEALSGVLTGPVRREMDEVGDMVGLDFILNVVINESKQVVQAFAGHHVDAHRAACRVVDEMYSVKTRPAEVVITCAGGAPKDINMYQAQKALDNAKGLVKPGGTIILVGQCPEGLGEQVFQRWMDEADTPEDLLKRIERLFELGGHKAAAIAQVLQVAEVYMVTDMSADMVEGIFLKKSGDLQSAIDSAVERHGDDARVVVMPYGGSTLPRQL